MLKLIPVDPGNWRTPLNVAEHQQHYAASHTTILARAWAYREQRSQVYYLEVGEAIVGVVMWHDCPELGCYILSELLVDQRYQRRGYAKEAVSQVLDWMRRDGRFRQCILCYIDGNEAAQQLYEGFGFRRTYDDDEDDELVMSLDL